MGGGRAHHDVGSFSSHLGRKKETLARGETEACNSGLIKKQWGEGERLGGRLFLPKCEMAFCFYYLRIQGEGRGAVLWAHLLQ